MDTLQKIKEPVAGEIARYEKHLEETLCSNSSLTQEMLSYILDTRGKGIRPLMVLLSAAMFNSGRELPYDSHIAAMLVEMTHTASLVHDDIIDEAAMRRGKLSVKAKWDASLAVLIGDYILARTYTLGLDNGYYRLTTYVAHVMTQLCEGEIIQSDQSGRLEMTRQIYDDIIYRKTASLMGRSCGAGAISVEAPQEDVDRMQRFGEALGMAFQIKDDILDYATDGQTGKSPCNDLREHKITLPLLSVLDASPDGERRRLLDLLAQAHDSEESIRELCDAIASRGGLEAASREMERYLTQARELILSFPESPYRDSLYELCDYLAGRRH